MVEPSLPPSQKPDDMKWPSLPVLVGAFLLIKTMQLLKTVVTLITFQLLRTRLQSMREKKELVEEISTNLTSDIEQRKVYATVLDWLNTDQLKNLQKYSGNDDVKEYLSHLMTQHPSVLDQTSHLYSAFWHMGNFPTATDRILGEFPTLLERSNKLLVCTLSQDDKWTFFDFLIRYSDYKVFGNLNEANNLFYDSEIKNFLSQFNQYLEESGKPFDSSGNRLLFFDPEAKNVFDLYASLSASYENSFYVNLLKEIAQEQKLQNTQMVENCLASMVQRSRMRDIPRLGPYTGGDFTLHYETHTSMELLEDSDQQVDKPLFGTIYVTNPRTMETRGVTFEIPIERNLTISETREKLTRLIYVIENALKVSEEYEKIKGWHRKIEENLLQAIAELAAGESANSAFYNLDISSPRPAVEAAKVGHLFLLSDGTLSLLPRISGSQAVQNLVTFSPQLLEATKASLEKASPSNAYSNIFFESIRAPTAIDENGFVMKKANFNIQACVVEEADNRVLRMKTIILVDAARITSRVTNYVLRESENVADVVKRISESGLLERDLLLTNAQYLREHVK